MQTAIQHLMDECWTKCLIIWPGLYDVYSTVKINGLLVLNCSQQKSKNKKIVELGFELGSLRNNKRNTVVRLVRQHHRLASCASNLATKHMATIEMINNWAFMYKMPFNSITQ